MAVKENEVIASRFITNEKGKKIAVIVDIKKFEWMEEMLEDIEDLRIIEKRKDEPDRDFEEYLKQRKGCPYVSNKD